MKAAALAAVLCTRVAFAQSPDVQRRALVEQALAARAHGDHTRAVDLFLRAGRIQMRAGLRFSLAEEYEALGDHRNACQQAVDCVAAMRSDPGHTESRTITEGCPAIEQSACAAVGEVQIRLPPSVPAGLEVAVEGRRIDLTEGAGLVAVQPGTVSVQASGNGVPPFRQAVALRAGERREIDVTFNEPPAIVTPAPVAPMVVESPRVVVSPVVPTPPAGAGETHGSGAGAGPWVLMTVGALALGTSAVLGFRQLPMANTAVSNDCNSARTECSNAVFSDNSNASHMALATNITLGVGGAAVLVGGLWLVLAPRSNDQERVTSAIHWGLGPLPGGFIAGVGGAL